MAGKGALFGGVLVGLVLLAVALTGPQFGAVSLLSSSPVTEATQQLTHAVAG